MYGQQQDLYNALTWQPDGKRNVRRTKTTWRMVETERDKLGINSWAKSKTVAKDRDKWRQCIRALCATWCE